LLYFGVDFYVGMTILLTLSLYQIGIYGQLPHKSTTLPYIGNSQLLILCVQVS